MTSTSAAAEAHAVQTGVVFIPLNKLKKSPKNARKTPHAKADIEALAASIAAKGMLQNLVVEPELESGEHTGAYFVQIGEGRRQAQLLRVKRKQIPATEPIRCIIDTTNDPLETSLDENITRSPMSAMDEVEAFAALVAGGMNPDDVARRFGCSVRLVEQRLALAGLSPKIRAAYRKGDINLDVARAFAINDDHAAQDRVFRQFAKPITHAQSIRNALTTGRIPAHDRLARFVGVETYEAAGGRITKDLFEDGVVFLDDGQLLQRLAGDKIEAIRAEVSKEGWGWTDIALGHAPVEGCVSERLQPRQRRLKPAEKETLSVLETRLGKVEQKLQDADDDALWRERDEIETQISTLRESAKIYDRSLMTHAGAAIAVDRNGAVIVARGLIKRADARKIAQRQRASATMSEQDDEDPVGDAPSERNAPAGPRLTKALVEHLSRARTRALRVSLAQNPQAALGLLVFVLLRRSASSANVVGIRIQTQPLAFDDDDLLERARTTLAEQAPEDEWRGLATCLDWPIDKLMQALAVLLAETLDFTHGGISRDDKRLQHAGDSLAAALDLDMRRYWEATHEFWEAAPKALALEALANAPSIAALSPEKREARAAALAKLKKAELARTAAQLLKDTGWLPEPLITPARAGLFAMTAAGERLAAENDADIG